MIRYAVLLLLLSCIASQALAQEISLDRALGELESSNESWQIVSERIEQARAARREARARLFPQLSVSGSTSYNGEEVAIGDRVVRREVDWALGSSATLTLFDGTAYPLVRQAGHNLAIAELDGAWQQLALGFEVESTYYALSAAQRDVAIATQTVALRQAYVDRATALEASGIALPLDVARATVQRLEAEQAVLEAEARRGSTADALAILLGRKPDGALRAAPTTDSRPPPSDASTTIDARADLLAGSRRIDAARSFTTSQWWALAPRLDLRGDARYGPPSFSSPDGVAWSLTLSATWLLYNGGATYARIRGAQSRTREAELAQRQLERSAEAGQVDALRNWRTAYRAVAVAEQLVVVARQAYDMTVARFESGLATSIEVTESSDQLFRAESTLSSARLTTDVAAAQYRYLSQRP